MPKQQIRYCRTCGGRLARDNPSSYCGPCGKHAGAAMNVPPSVPPEFWDTDPMRVALASWHIGQVIAPTATTRGMAPGRCRRSWSVAGSA